MPQFPDANVSPTQNYKTLRIHLSPTHRADPPTTVPELPSPRRTRADATADLPASAALGEVHSRAGPNSPNAAVVCRSDAWIIRQRSLSNGRRDRNHSDVDHRGSAGGRSEACTAAKGLFATLDAIALTNQRFDAQKAPILIRLIVAGEFVSAGDQTQFAKRIAQPDLNRRMGADTSKSESLIHYAGFVEGAAMSLIGLSTRLARLVTISEGARRVGMCADSCFSLGFLRSAFAGCEER